MKIPLAWIVGCALALCAASAEAQMPGTTSKRPYRGLFGGGVGDAEQLLKINLWLGAGYDEDLLSNGTEARPNPTVMAAGGYGELSGDLTYRFSGTRLSIDGGVQATTRYGRAGGTDLVGAYTGRFATSVQATRATRVSVAQNVAYQPMLSMVALSPFGDALAPAEPTSLPSADLDWTVERREYVHATSGLDLEQSIGARTTVSAGYAYRLAAFGAGTRDLRTHSGRARMSYGLLRGLAVRVGYEHSDNGPEAVVRNLDAGFDLQRALGRTRRTTISLGSGSTAIERGGQTDYRATANAGLSREIGRTWKTSLLYRRSAGFTEQFLDPVFADEASVDIRGMVHRRLQWQSRVAATLGTVGTTSADNQFNTYGGRVGATFALSRNTALALTYSFTYYELAADAVTRVAMPRQSSRHAVQLRMGLWSPLIYRARKADASR